MEYIYAIPAAHAEYSATNVIPPIGAVAVEKTTVIYLLIRLLHLTGCKNQQPH